MASSSQVYQRLKMSIFVTSYQKFLPHNVWILNHLKTGLNSLGMIFFNEQYSGTGWAVATITDCSGSFEINEQLQWGFWECWDVPLLHSSPACGCIILSWNHRKIHLQRDLRQFLVQSFFFLPLVQLRFLGALSGLVLEFSRAGGCTNSLGNLLQCCWHCHWQLPSLKMGCRICSARSPARCE